MAADSTKFMLRILKASHLALISHFVSFTAVSQFCLVFDNQYNGLLLTKLLGSLPLPSPPASALSHRCPSENTVLVE